MQTLSGPNCWLDDDVFDDDDDDVDAVGDDDDADVDEDDDGLDNDADDVDVDNDEMMSMWEWLPHGQENVVCQCQGSQELAPELSAKRKRACPASILSARLLFAAVSVQGVLPLNLMWDVHEVG